MNPLIIVLAAVVGIGLYLFRLRDGEVSIGDIMQDFSNPPVPAPEVNTSVPYANIFREYGNLYNVDWRLIAAHAKVESNYNPDAVNKADNESIGMMQLLCRPDGNGGCTNDLPAIPDWKGTKRKDLLSPDFNVRIAAQLIADNIKTYRMPRAVAVYNSWSERKSGQYGPFANQKYVDAVLKEYERLKKAFP